MAPYAHRRYGTLTARAKAIGLAGIPFRTVVDIFRLRKTNEICSAEVRARLCLRSGRDQTNEVGYEISMTEILQQGAVFSQYLN
jgi:hypothetical protein